MESSGKMMPFMLAVGVCPTEINSITLIKENVPSVRWLRTRGPNHLANIWPSFGRCLAWDHSQPVRLFFSNNFCFMPVYTAQPVVVQCLSLFLWLVWLVPMGNIVCYTTFPARNLCFACRTNCLNIIPQFLENKIILSTSEFIQYNRWMGGEKNISIQKGKTKTPKWQTMLPMWGNGMLFIVFLMYVYIYVEYDTFKW